MDYKVVCEGFVSHSQYFLREVVCEKNRCYRTQNRNKFFDILDRYSISYGDEKGTSSDEDVPLCGRRESNPYASRHQILSLACLPISTRPQQYCLHFPFGKDCKCTTFYRICKLTTVYLEGRLEYLKAEAQSYAEAHRQVLVLLAEPMPKFKAVVVIGFSRVT